MDGVKATLAVLVALAAPPPAAPEPSRMPDAPRAAPARPGDVAIREELDAARRAGTREAYDLFLARHPDHPLAEEARREREGLRT